MTDPAPNTDSVKITLDGAEIPAQKGEMIIAAAERAGNYIPRFCYHPRMKPVGMCRMCLVEVKGPRGFSLQPACFVAVADGQEVVTNSEKVRKAQDGVLEFLLINHPLDCPVCDKGGECPLQDQTLTYGPGETRFVEEKRHFVKPIAISDLVYLDRERCIQCARCTRFADEVAGEALIDFIGRGDQIEVNTFPDSPFKSYFSGNTVQICPVGALTASPYRFKARPWDLDQVESTCTTCSVGCRVAVQSSSNRLTRYLGIDSAPVNHGWLCDRGRFDFEVINSPRRVTAPMVRKGNELVESSWSEALGRVAGNLRPAIEAGRSSSVAILGGARLANEDAYAWSKLARAVIGTDSVDAQMGDGLPAEVVLGLPRASIDQACAAGVVILLAPDLREELPVLFLRLRQAAVESGLVVIEISPVATAMSEYAASRLLHRPGEAGLLARALVAEDDPGGDVAGVAAAAVAEARRLLAGSPRDGATGTVVVLGRTSLAESGEDVVDAAGVLAGARWGHDGAGPDEPVRFLSGLRRGNVHGALDMGLAPGMLPGRLALEEGREWFSRAWGGLPAARGSGAAGILSQAAAGEISTLVLLGADPVADFPDAQVARAGLAGAEFVVAVDAYLTASSSQADVVLPAAMYTERAGTTTNLEGRITRLGQKLVAAGLARPDWVIAAELAIELDADLGFDSLDAIWDEIERLAPSHAGITRQVLERAASSDGVLAPLPATPVHISTRRSGPAGGPTTDPMAVPGIGSVQSQGAANDAGHLFTEPSSGQSSFGESASRQSSFDDGSGEGYPEPPPARPACVSFAAPQARPEVPSRDGYALRLVSGRRLYDLGTSVMMCESLAKLISPQRVRANPYDLDRLGLTTGDEVRVRSSRANLVMEVDADSGVPRGVVALGFNLAGEGASDLIDSTGPVSDLRLETP
ncbi:MAG: NADH-quinone oxidoreductase subunit NuoG [Acidimicrobiales bacterium]